MTTKEKNLDKLIGQQQELNFYFKNTTHLKVLLSSSKMPLP